VLLPRRPVNPLIARKASACLGGEGGFFFLLHFPRRGEGGCPVSPPSRSAGAEWSDPGRHCGAPPSTPPGEGLRGPALDPPAPGLRPWTPVPCRRRRNSPAAQTSGGGRIFLPMLAAGGLFLVGRGGLSARAGRWTPAEATAPLLWSG
jgi:hypothetical protein